MVPLERSSALSTKSSVPCRTNLFSSLSASSTLLASGSPGLGALPGKRQEVGLAHVEVEVDRIERDEGRKQRGWAGRGAAAGNQVADRYKMRADAPGERRRNAAMIEIELGVANLRPWHHRPWPAPRWSDVRWSTFSSFRSRLRSRVAARAKLRLGELKTRAARSQAVLGLCKLDLIRPRVDGEEQVAFVDDLAVLEVKFPSVCRRPAREVRRDRPPRIAPGNSAACRARARPAC